MQINMYLINKKTIPRHVKFFEITELKQMEERFYDIDANFINILGWNKDSLDFYPNTEPPNNDEILAWFWVIRPDLKEEILKYCNETLKKLIQEYKET